MIIITALPDESKIPKAPATTSSVMKSVMIPLRRKGSNRSTLLHSVAETRSLNLRNRECNPTALMQSSERPRSLRGKSCWMNRGDTVNMIFLFLRLMTLLYIASTDRHFSSKQHFIDGNPIICNETESCRQEHNAPDCGRICRIQL